MGQLQIVHPEPVKTPDTKVSLELKVSGTL